MKTPTDTYCMYGELGLFGTLNSKQRRDQTPGQTGLLSVGKLNRCVFFHPQWYQHSGVGFMACEFWLLLTNHNAIHANAIPSRKEHSQQSIVLARRLSNSGPKRWSRK